MIKALLLGTLLSASVAVADEQGAKSLIAKFERETEAFLSQLKAAPDIAARRELWSQAPNREEFGKLLGRELDGGWRDPWLLDYAPILLEKAPEYSIRAIEGAPEATPLTLIRDSAERFHFENEKVGRLVLALTIDTGPTTRAFIEKVEREHPSKKVQGQAALALAFLSRELGDGGEVARFKAQRLAWVRKAIIESANVEYNGVSVGDLANEFLFAITRLDKGMSAPELLGWNVSGDAMRLSDFRGKPVVLVFWHTRMEAAEETLAFMRKIEERLGPKGVAVLGVASEDSTALRPLVKEGIVTWQNWIDDKGELAKTYQIRNYPASWVLDKEGQVCFRGVPGAFVELTAEALVR